MLNFIGGMIGLIITVGGGLFAFGMAREFVRNKLRFVDGVHNPMVPWVAAGATLLVAIPLAMIIPFVGAPTGIALAAATGLGTASGVKALKRGE